ncbi:MAG: zinc metallopeptidase [Clostridiales bacterium]|jgi:Zn-dependent membrane protease YugP|nr:zinc metallopeptidase [Clostridiales bacterium]
MEGFFFKEVPMYLDSTMLLLIPGLLLALFAQSRVKATYAKYARVPIASRLTGAEAARRILRDSGNDVVQIQPVQGQLTDHYDPKSEVLRLSEGVYDTASVSAVGIAAHEAGHAMQKRDDYAPLGLRTLVVPTVRIGSTLSMPIFIIGLLMSFRPLIYAGIVLFSLTVVFSLITLPVEFNASKRAVAMLRNSGVVTTAEEEKGVRAVLNAAAWTYVAAAVGAVLQLLRLVLLARGGSRRND